MEQAAMTGRNAEPITAASVVDNVERVWYVVVVVITDGVYNSSLRSFGGAFTVEKVPPNAERAKHIEDTSASVYLVC